MPKFALQPNKKYVHYNKKKWWNTEEFEKWKWKIMEEPELQMYDQFVCCNPFCSLYCYCWPCSCSFSRRKSFLFIVFSCYNGNTYVHVRFKVTTMEFYLFSFGSTCSKHSFKHLNWGNKSYLSAWTKLDEEPAFVICLCEPTSSHLFIFLHVLALNTVIYRLQKPPSVVSSEH